MSEHLRIFNSVVEPILLYGAELWGLSNPNDVDNIQSTFIKKILGLKQTTPTSMIMLETGQLPLSAKREIRVISYWARLISAESEKKLTRTKKCTKNSDKWTMIIGLYRWRDLSKI